MLEETRTSWYKLVEIFSKLGLDVTSGIDTGEKRLATDGKDNVTLLSIVAAVGFKD